MLYVISGFIIGFFFGMGFMLIVTNNDEDFSFKEEIYKFIRGIRIAIFCICHKTNPFKTTWGAAGANYYHFICKLNDKDIEHYLKLFSGERREREVELVKYCKDTQILSNIMRVAEKHRKSE